MQVAIVGDSKSGTHAMCDLLQGLGYAVGDETSKIGTNADFNRLFTINATLIKKLGGSPELPPKLPQNWESQTWLDSLYTEALDSIDRLNAQSQDWAWYDPTTNTTAAFWQKVLPSMSFAVCVRNPHDVVALSTSANSVERSCAYARWHWTYLNILGATDPDNRYSVIYDSLMTSAQYRRDLAESLRDSNTLTYFDDVSRIHFDGTSTSIDKLLSDNDIHDAARRLYIGLASGEDRPGVQQQIDEKEMLLSVLYPVIERTAAYDALAAKCVDIEHQLAEINRSKYLASNLGTTLMAGAVQLARRSKAILSKSKKAVKNAAALPVPKSDIAAPTLNVRPNADKIVVCAGHARSGSTWLFNVVRCAYICAGYKTYGAWINTYKPGIRADIHVVKAHDFNQELSNIADLVVITKRDLRDCAASIMRKQWTGTSPEVVAGTMRDIITHQILPWRKRADISLTYEEFSVDKVSAIAGILEQLGLSDVDPAQVHTWVENLTSEIYPDINPITHLHPQHITEGGVHSFGQTLTADQIAAVNGVCDEFKTELAVEPKIAPSRDPLVLNYAHADSSRPIRKEPVRPMASRSATPKRVTHAARNPKPAFDRDSFADRNNEEPSHLL